MLMLSQSEALCFESELTQNTGKMADVVNPVAFPVSVKYKLALALGAHHLPPQELNHVLMQLLTFNTP